MEDLSRILKKYEDSRMKSFFKVFLLISAIVGLILFFSGCISDGGSSSAKKKKDKEPDYEIIDIYADIDGETISGIQV